MLAGAAWAWFPPDEMIISMKTAKTLFGILTITSIVLALAGCGKKQEEKPQSEQAPPKVEASSPSQTATPMQEVKAAETVAATPAEENTPIDPKGIRAIGLFLTAEQLLPQESAYSAKDAEAALLKVVPPDFLQTGAECDLRVVDWSQTTNLDLPFAYILFKKGEFEKGVKVTEKTMTENILPILESGFQESLGTEHDIMSPVKLFILGRDKKEFQSCSAVGLALVPDRSSSPFGGVGWTAPAGQQGGAGMTLESSFLYVLIEPGSLLQKSIMSAPYFTNIFATASARETEIAKPFLGTWKTGSGDNVVSVEIGSDRTFRCNWDNWKSGGKETTTGNYWVISGYDKIVLLKDGKYWISGTIGSDKTLVLGGSDEGPSGYFEKAQ
jgi:predicted small lipoprotein YifL